MVGRKYEITYLKKLYASNKFEFLIMYGRRRVGKTTLLSEFAKTHEAMFYSAEQKNDKLNLEDFSRLVQMHFDGNFIASFRDWKALFEYISLKCQKRTTIIIDEFPFIAEQNPSVKSALQHVIDHEWKNNPNILLILCGSSVSFMENDIMGIKSPLHGRQTSSIEIKPFNYLESSKFFPNYSNEKKVLAYGILGGVPRYLEAFDESLSIKKNIEDKILVNGAFLHEEPMNLLRSELRDINVYNSILSAIANGKNRISEIADFVHEDANKVSKYLITLQTIRLIEKQVPCFESKNSRKSIYVITDNFFKFWFRYQFSNNIYYEMLGSKSATESIIKDIPNYMGLVFEEICKEYLIQEAKNGKLPFVPFYASKWWGNNPYLKCQDDVDILLADKQKRNAIFVECKYTSRPMPHTEYADLQNAMQAFPNIKNKKMMFISKSGYEDSVKRHAKEDGSILLSIDDLFA